MPQLSKEIGNLDPTKLKASGLYEERMNAISALMEQHIQTQIVSPFPLRWSTMNSQFY